MANPLPEKRVQRPGLGARLARVVLFHNLGAIVRLGLRLVCGTRVVGEENVPPRGGVIVAANHSSLSDAVVLQAFVPRILTYLMNDKFYYLPVVHPLVRFWGVLVVKREGINKEALRAAEAVLAGGDAIGIFPEGGITREGPVREAQPGVALLAQRAGVPIVPVGMAGTERLLPPGSGRPYRARLRAFIGKPILPGERRRDDLAAEVTAALRACAERAREL